MINHGVPKEVIERMTNSAEEFFKLSQEEKKAYSQLPNNVQGYGQVFVLSEDQKLDWGDMFYIITRPIHQRNTRFWPTYPTCFRYIINTHDIIFCKSFSYIDWSVRPKLCLFSKRGRSKIEENI